MRLANPTARSEVASRGERGAHDVEAGAYSRGLTWQGPCLGEDREFGLHPRSAARLDTIRGRTGTAGGTVRRPARLSMLRQRADPVTAAVAEDRDHIVKRK